MQEQQGNLMPQLSGLPGPRPFNKGKNKMENENTSSNPMQADGKPDMGKPVTDSVDEIVAKAAAALGAGKAFGGWTDKVEEGIVAGAPTTNYRGSPSSPTRASTQHAMTRDRQLNQAKKNRTASGKAGGEGMKKPSPERRASAVRRGGIDHTGSASRSNTEMGANRRERSNASIAQNMKRYASDTVEEGNNSPLVKTGPDSSRPVSQQQYTNTTRPSDVESTMSRVRNIAKRTMKQQNRQTKKK